MLQIDLETKQVIHRWTYVTPRAEWGTDTSTVGHCFTGVSVAAEGRIVLCTQRELLIYDPQTQSVTQRRSDTSFNDLHHAAITSHGWLVANTGRDAVSIGTEASGFTLQSLGAPVPSREGDLRAADFKPHRLHPNHLLVRDDEVWVTCGVAGDVRALHTTRRIAISDRVIHDGVWHRGRAWFTSVDGTIVAVALDEGRVTQRWRLSELAPGVDTLGWCRGLAPVDEGWVVGLTRLRSTRWRRNLAWLKGALRGRQDAAAVPTQLVWVDPTCRRQPQRLMLENHGMDAVFGVMAA